jgi:hypothetical protein
MILQISQVLAGYVSDYFEQESQHVRNQYVSIMRKAVDDASLNKVSTGTLMTLPRLRAEKLKSIPIICRTVANKQFLNYLLAVTSDAVQRMESIGRDDKRLPTRIKDLFLLELGFLSQGVLLPWSQACTTMLLKMSTARNSSAALPPLEFLSTLSAFTYAAERLRWHFDAIFSRPLHAVPNILAVCSENLKKVLKTLEISAKDQLRAWTLCLVVYLETILYNLQSKYDYNPKLEFTGHGFTSCTPACDAVCKTLLSVANAVKSHAADLSSLDMRRLFWLPFGQQLMGTLISHFRKQKISQDGTHKLLKDFDEYYNV